MRSFDLINYAIRPNKTVERKIVFAGLAKLSRVFGLSRYRYIGFGAPWFVDFLMAHKILGMESMISIESSSLGFQRSTFNCPLACISPMEGLSTHVIPELGLEQSPATVWFDYDLGIGGPVLADIELLMSKCALNSIVIVTIAAAKDLLPTKDENEQPIDEEASLRRIAGDLVPTPLPPKRLQPSHYAQLLCQVLTNQFESAVVNSGRAAKFIKLFEIVYSDSKRMATVGGIVAASEVFKLLVAFVV